MVNKYLKAFCPRESDFVCGSNTICRHFRKLWTNDWYTINLIISFYQFINDLLIINGKFIYHLYLCDQTFKNNLGINKWFDRAYQMKNLLCKFVWDQFIVSLWYFCIWQITLLILTQIFPDVPWQIFFISFISVRVIVNFLYLFMFIVFGKLPF